MVFDYVLVVILTVFSGAWALPAGISFGLDPVGVYASAVTGSAAFAVLVLFVGGRYRDVLFERVLPGAAERVATSRAGTIAERWGSPGLALLGGIVLGPTITLAAALVLGVDRRRFLLWYVVGTVGGFAILTGFWAAVL